MEQIIGNTAREMYISSDVKFFTIDECTELLGWSRSTVQKLFNDPRFPATDFGRNKIVEAHALIDYFSVRHEKAREKYWR